MALDFTKELYDEILLDIEESNYSAAVKKLSKLHPYDIAEVVAGMDTESITHVFDLMEDELASEILSELDDDLTIRFCENFGSKMLYEKFLQSMDSDDAADLVNALGEEKLKAVTNYLKDEIGAEAADIISLLKYEEDTAGGLMAKELIRVKLDWSVNQCVEEIRRQADEVDTMYAVYVVDDSDRLKGLIPFSKLIISDPEASIANFYDPRIVLVQDTAKAEEVSDIMRKYDLVALPVVDFLGKLVGRITIDDVVDFITEEADEDYQLASGISENVEYSDKIWVLSRARLPWLFLGLLGGIASSKVIGLYEADLNIYPEMAFFIPLIAAMGGNAGVQSSAIVVQSLANKSISDISLGSKLSKEFMVSLINGLLCSLALLIYGSFMLDSINLSVTVSTALLAVIIIAAVLGAIIPLLLNRLKVDPALATGPFITTTNDLLGLGIYFFIGRLLYDVSFM